MIQELDLKPEQILLIIPLLIWITWVIWQFKSHSEPYFEPKRNYHRQIKPSLRGLYTACRQKK